MGVSETEAAHQLRGLTTDQKVDKALRHFCFEQKIPYKRHLSVCHPSLNEQNTLAIRGITRTVIDIANDSLESKQYLEKRLAFQDAAIRKQDTECTDLKSVVRQQNYAIKIQKQKHWELKKFVRKLDPELSYSSEEEDGLKDVLYEKMDAQLRKLYLDSEHEEEEFSHKFNRLQNKLRVSLREIKDAAAAGNASAQYCLGRMNYTGIGVPKNLEAAAKWVSKAAKQKYGEMAEPALPELVAGELLKNGVVLRQSNHLTKAIETYEVVDTYFGETKETALRILVAKTLRNKGIALAQDGRWIKAIEAYDELDTRFGEDAEPELREIVAKALYYKGYTFGQQGLWNKAIEAYQVVDTRFKCATESALRKIVAEALLNTGGMLRQLGKLNEAIETYEAVDTRFGEEPTLSELVVKAIFNEDITQRELAC